MHHVHVDSWSQGKSVLHARDPRAKILTLLVFLTVLATTPADAALTLGIDAAVLVAGILIAGLPLLQLLSRAMVVLPFSLTFGLISWMTGDHLRAIGLVEKSYLSAAAVLLIVGTTSLPALLNGFEKLGAPRMLVLVAQFIYRYLFVISEQAQHMRLAASARQGDPRLHGKGRFRAAAGALAVLFARSYYRADGIHRAMLARAFTGRFPLLSSLHFRLADGLFLLTASAFLIVVRTQ
ncbi:MAG TPA: energy-coupling factor transporter transmembrane component T [Bryobacteraceae bacterium]|nr:energy-coupling factor transporter transmembrane component T [Bryobacteraceae bacterium]